MAEQIIFYILALIIVLGSVMAVVTQKIIHSAVYLLFVLLSSAGLYLLLDYHFLMAVQIAVYAGGVMVLFIFAILLTNQPGIQVKKEKPIRIFASSVLALFGLCVCGHLVFHNVWKAYTYVTQQPEQNMQQIGLQLMGTGKFEYLLPFESVSILLLACIIGGLMIAKKK